MFTGDAPISDDVLTAVRLFPDRRCVLLYFFLEKEGKNVRFEGFKGAAWKRFSQYCFEKIYVVIF